MEFSVYEIVRVVLGVLELISGIVVYGRTVDVCHNYTICDAVVALSIIAWLGLIAVIALHYVAFCARPILSFVIEAICYGALAFLWFIIAIVASVKLNITGITGLEVPDGVTNPVSAAIAFAWISLLLHIASAVVAFLHSRSSPKEQSPGVTSASASNEHVQPAPLSPQYP